MHERDNPFDLFAIAVKKTKGETVGHLPQENSRVTKHLMDRGARFTVFLTSSQYCVSPLVPGGVGISCEVGIYVSPTQTNDELVRIYNNLIQPPVFSRPGSFMIDSLIQRQQKYSRHLPLTNTRKKMLEKKNKRKIGQSSEKHQKFFQC